MSQVRKLCVSLQQGHTPACAVCVCVGGAAVGLPVISKLLPFDLRQPRVVGQSAARTEVERLLGHPVPPPVRDRETGGLDHRLTDTPEHTIGVRL